MPALLVAAGVIIENGRVLLTQRPGGAHLEKLWEFPGGKVEEGESPPEALVRELREEIATEVTVQDILEVTFFRYPKRDVLLLFYRATRKPPLGEIRHLGVAGHAWVSAAELPRYPMPPADLPVLSKVRRILEAGG